MRYDPIAALARFAATGPQATPFGPRPAVVGQLGQTLDGRIATPTGKSKYISGTAALTHLHRLRAAVDAVVVGVNTVIADDPQLTVRLASGRSPLRVVIDPRGRLPESARCLNPDSPGGALVIRAAGAPDASGVESVAVTPDADGALSPEAILAALYRRGVRRVLVEGGADTLSRAIDAGVVDWLHVTVSPLILGSGKAGLSLAPIDELDEALRPAPEVFAFEDGDMLYCCDLRQARRGAILPDAGLAAAE